MFWRVNKWGADLGLRWKGSHEVLVSAGDGGGGAHLCSYFKDVPFHSRSFRSKNNAFLICRSVPGALRIRSVPVCS